MPDWRGKGSSFRGESSLKNERGQTGVKKKKTTVRARDSEEKATEELQRS